METLYLGKKQRTTKAKWNKAKKENEQEKDKCNFWICLIKSSVCFFFLLGFPQFIARLLIYNKKKKKKKNRVEQQWTKSVKECGWKHIFCSKMGIADNLQLGIKSKIKNDTNNLVRQS